MALSALLFGLGVRAGPGQLLQGDVKVIWAFSVGLTLFPFCSYIPNVLLLNSAWHTEVLDEHVLIVSIISVVLQIFFKSQE